ncbi:hypothetical protein SDC9_115018 [bioreactor metagenome]|uniref:Uncharacterized protein n=1 Tax=bioreactor metagenome TaxID=1076179 RepID=A0A645BS78_9ZZZZ
MIRPLIIWDPAAGSVFFLRCVLHERSCVGDPVCHLQPAAGQRGHCGHHLEDGPGLRAGLDSIIAQHISGILDNVRRRLSAGHHGV